MAPFCACEGPETVRRLWAPGVEDCPHELRDILGERRRHFGTFFHAVATWFDEQQAPKGHLLTKI